MTLCMDNGCKKRGGEFRPGRIISGVESDGGLSQEFFSFF